VITKSLREIRKWLPDARLSNLRLFPESKDRLLVEQARGHTDSKGQFVLPVEKTNLLDADEAFVQAQSAEEAGDLQSAESLYRRVMNLDPYDPAAGLNLGNLLRVQQRMVEAEAAYRWAVKADPNFPPAWHNLADLLDESARLPRRLIAKGARLLPIPNTPTPCSTWRCSYSGLGTTQKRRCGGRGILNATAPRNGPNAPNAH
jgi:tetratricopeptide (TPR) repeat protein